MTMKHSVKFKCLKIHRSFLNLIGHGVVMEGNRKKTGCLQTFGGHCMLVFSVYSLCSAITIYFDFHTF